VKLSNFTNATPLAQEFAQLRTLLYNRVQYFSQLFIEIRCLAGNIAGTQGVFHIGSSISRTIDDLEEQNWEFLGVRYIGDDRFLLINGTRRGFPDADDVGVRIEGCAHRIFVHYCT
jgi:hypothetical protein